MATLDCAKCALERDTDWALTLIEGNHWSVLSTGVTWPPSLLKMLLSLHFNYKMMLAAVLEIDWRGRG